MKRLLTFLALVACMSVPAFAQNGSVNGFCDLGASQALVSGLKSTNYQLGNIPRCQVTVYVTGTLTLATIYSNIGGTPLANPFTAGTNGQWLFFAAQAAGYDIVLSGGVAPNTYPTPVTLTDVFAGGGGGGGTGCIPGAAGFLLLSGAGGTCPNSLADYGVTTANTFTFPKAFHVLAPTGSITFQTLAASGSVFQVDGASGVNISSGEMTSAGISMTAFGANGSFLLETQGTSGAVIEQVSGSGNIGLTQLGTGAINLSAGHGQSINLTSAGNLQIFAGGSSSIILNASGSLIETATSGQALNLVTSTAALLQGNGSEICTFATGCGAGSGTVTSIATTGPITGGTITTTGTIGCAICVVVSAPGVGIAHFAGSTQTVTSSAVNLAGADVTGLLPHANIAATAVTPGSYTNANITVAADGSITAAANGSGGSSGISGLTANFIPKAGSATTITANSALDDGVTTAATITSTEPINIVSASSGAIGLGGSSSGLATITVQAAAGTPTITLGTSSGTPAVTASSPLAINTTTGNITCSSCLTSQVYPGAGIANSTGSAWGTSYTTTGSGTVVALATSPVLVTPTLGVASATSIATSGINLNTAPTGANQCGLTNSTGGIIDCWGTNTSTLGSFTIETHHSDGTSPTLIATFGGTGNSVNFPVLNAGGLVKSTTGNLGIATGSDVSSTIQGLTGCNTATFVFIPQANDCVAPSGGTPAYPLTITGGVSGGVVYGNSSTQLTVSPAGTANVLMKWGGAGTAPGSSVASDNGSVFAIPETTSIGSSPPACTAGTAGGDCETEGTAPTNVSGASSRYPDGTAHEWFAATAGTNNYGMFNRTQPGAIHSTANTAAISTATLCASAAGACNVAGQYKINVYANQSGTACSLVGATAALTPSITWTDATGSHTSAIPLTTSATIANTPLSVPTLAVSLIPTTGALSWAEGDFVIWSTGAVIQYATAYTNCTTGTFSYDISLAVTRVQ